jgi:hypothetical protein
VFRYCTRPLAASDAHGPESCLTWRANRGGSGVPALTVAREMTKIKDKEARVGGWKLRQASGAVKCLSIDAMQWRLLPHGCLSGRRIVYLRLDRTSYTGEAMRISYVAV